jgi:hypothetical protein
MVPPLLKCSFAMLFEKGSVESTHKVPMLFIR